MNPLVSVIVVTYNAAEYIEHAVRSFLEQTYENKELVIIDGDSKDETLQIIEKNQSEKIRWISEPDKGIYDAMNKGIGIAKGEWIYFLGADDYFIDKNVLEKLFGPENKEIEILYGDVYSVLLQRNYDGPTSIEKLLFSNLCHQSIFYRKTVFEKAGLYDLRYKLFSDWEFNVRCFIDFKFITKYVPVVIANYAASGLSTVYGDTLFMQDFLIPKNLKYLQDAGAGRLNNIVYYDRWWRLLRNARLEKNIKFLYANHPLPPKIIKMHSFQRKIPQRVLFMGIFSKIFMGFSYLFAR